MVLPPVHSKMQGLKESFLKVQLQCISVDVGKSSGSQVCELCFFEGYSKKVTIQDHKRHGHEIHPSREG